MKFLDPLTLYIFLFFLFLFILLKIHESSKTRQKLPPGPWKLPVIGNLHQLICLRSLPHHAFKTLAQKHDPIMSIKLGNLQTVIVSSPELAKEITTTNDVAFANRAELMVLKIVMYNSSGIASTSYGDYWRQMRKLWVRELFGHQKVRSFRSLMESEVLRLVETVRLCEGIPINLTEKVLSAEYGIISRAMVGRVSIKNHEESLISIIKEVVSIAGVFNFADAFPSLKFLHFLSAGSKQRLENIRERIDCILEDILAKHEEKGVSESEEDVVDVMLKVTERKDLQVPITRDHIKAMIFEMFFGGVETSSLTIEWAMSELIKNPRVMHKAQAEVRKTLIGKKSFSENDIQNLSYLKMVIKETLRLHPPGPFICPRRCREQTMINGYDIPVNTTVMVNVWAIGRDPEVWREPEKFEPERFEDVAIDYNGTHFELIPFGAGRRICPGIAFGVASVELSLANLLYHFDWGIPGGIGSEEFDMTEKFGASAGRKNNLCLIAKCYDPSDLMVLVQMEIPKLRVHLNLEFHIVIKEIYACLKYVFILAEN